ncbi:Glycosyltransferase Gtf1 [uncultured archaeon]|nr:Glycosyltransferase Gtf1 [uncultured archaeon]
MIKIKHISQGIGGELVVIEKIIKYMNKQKISSEIISFTKNKNHRSIIFEKFFDEEIITLKKLGILKDYTKDSEIIFYHYIFNFSSLIFLLYLKIFCNKKIICVFHNNIDSFNINILKELYYLIRKITIINLSIFYADKLIFITETSKKGFLKFCIMYKKINKNSYVINNAIEKSIILKKSNIKYNTMNILFVGRLSKYKGFIDFISLVKNSKEDLKFRIIGEGKLKNIIPSSKNLEYLGFIKNEDIFKYYDKSNILILPSYNETFGLVILEAMARGLVVLASDLPAIREYFVEGRNGYLFPPGDVEKMKELILYLKNNPKEIERISKNNLRDISKFTAEKQASKYIKVYEEVLKENEK